MTFPVFAKTWQLTPNTVIAAESTQAIQTQTVLLAMKNQLKAFSSNPWIVQFSSNCGNNGAGAAASGTAGTAGDLVDRWAVGNVASGANSTNDINFNTAGNRHSWIVLRQTGIQANFEICIDCNVSGSSGSASIIVSPSAAFTGGTATARPTATDETVVISAATFLSIPAGLPRWIMHAWQSTDGACTRIMIWSQGQTNGLFWIMDKGQSPVTGWTTPSFWAMTTGATFTNLGTGTNIKMRGGGATPNFTGTFTEERWNNGVRLATQIGIGTSPNTFSSEWPAFPIGVAANGVTNSGRLCNVYDLWWCPSGINSGDTMPVSLTARTHVAMNGLILPWTSGSDVPLLA